MFKKLIREIKWQITENKRQRENARRDKDIIRFTVKDVNSGKVETLTMDRLGYNNYMVYSFDKELVEAECVKRA